MTLPDLTPRRTIALIAGLVLMALLALSVPSCLSKWRSERAQSRVDRSQADAASNSAGDAIATVTGAGKRETASEAMTRSNEREIRDAEGAGEKVKPGVDAAGRRALCRRPAYANDPKCRGVGQ